MSDQDLNAALEALAFGDLHDPNTFKTILALPGFRHISDNGYLFGPTLLSLVESGVQKELLERAIKSTYRARRLKAA
jgi:hypothetical protein